MTGFSAKADEKEVKPILEVIYPPAQSNFDTRDNDFIEILRTALEKTEASDGPFIMYPTQVKMNPARFRHQLMQGTGLNVIWAASTRELEENLLSIKIPLRKGILGYRVLLIDKQNQNKFLSISKPEDLQQLKAGQGASWIDGDILTINGYNLIKGNDYAGLFKMLMSGRFDYFPRGINEVNNELTEMQKIYPNIAIERSILMYYPFPKFFYVNRKNIALAERLERGLNIMLEDGTFERIFMKHNQNYIRMFQSQKWKVFKLENPFLPDDIPFDRKELWLDFLDTKTK